MNSIVRYIKPWFESVITNISVTCMRDYGTAESMPHASFYDTLNTFSLCFSSTRHIGFAVAARGFLPPGANVCVAAGRPL